MRVSPDGQKIVFTSDRFGNAEIWTSPADGSGQPFQLTRLRQISDRSDWSPNSQRIAFSSIIEGNSEVYVVDAEGGEPKRLTNNPESDGSPSWSHDGRWIYFNSGRSGTGQIWRMSPEGEGARQVTQDGGGRPRASKAGQYLYYQKDQNIWRVPVEGGQEVPILEERVVGAGGFDIVGDRLYYGKNRRGGGFSIHYLDLNTKEKKEVYGQAGSVELSTGSIAVTANEKWIYYAFSDMTVSSDIMLIENFR